MPYKKKIKKKVVTNNNGFKKIATLTSNSISNAFSNYKKNKELEKIQEIKSQKLKERNQLQKERKELKNCFNFRISKSNN